MAQAQQQDHPSFIRFVHTQLQVPASDASIDNLFLHNNGLAFPMLPQQGPAQNVQQIPVNPPGRVAVLTVLAYYQQANARNGQLYPHYTVAQAINETCEEIVLHDWPAAQNLPAVVNPANQHLVTQLGHRCLEELYLQHHPQDNDQLQPQPYPPGPPQAIVNQVQPAPGVAHPPLQFQQLPQAIQHIVLNALFTAQPDIVIYNPWHYQWSATATYHDVPDGPSSYSSFKNTGIRLYIPTDIFHICLSRGFFRTWIASYAAAKKVTVSNCYLSQMVSSLNSLPRYKELTTDLLHGTRTMVIRSGRYAKTEGRITQFSQHCKQVRNIRFHSEKPYEWARDPNETRAPQHRQGRICRHRSYIWPTGGLPMAILPQERWAFHHLTWPRGLETSFRRHLYSTVEWRNARKLLAAINRKRALNRQHQRRQHAQVSCAYCAKDPCAVPCRMLFQCELMMRSIGLLNRRRYVVAELTFNVETRALVTVNTSYARLQS